MQIRAEEQDDADKEGIALMGSRLPASLPTTIIGGGSDSDRTTHNDT